jgi:MATE family multidrug resistance protein
MLRLALPVVLGEIGWVSLGVVDVMMVGRVDAESVGALSLGRALVMLVTISGMGLLLGLDTVVSHAHGAGSADESRAWLVQGSWLALAISPLALLACHALGLGLSASDVDPRVRTTAVAFLDAVRWGVPPLLLYFAFRRYLQAIGRVRPILLALVSANGLNLFGNWVLIRGHLGAPALGAVGSAWATVLAMTWLALTLLGAIVLYERGEHAHRPLALRPDRARLARLLRLGGPAALQLIIEVSAISLVTTLVGRLAPAALAAHQIVLNAASVTYMVPLGISSAAAVRVGHALGRGDARGARAAGWCGIALACGFMALAGAAFAVLPRAVLSAFTSIPEVVAIGVPLLYLAAAFQLFDGLQIVTTGALRGAGDTRSGAVVLAIAWWALAVPVGLWLCFDRALGILGLWAGLTLGLVAAGCFLVPVWIRVSARFARLSG